MINVTHEERERLSRLLGDVMDDESVVPWMLGEEQVLSFLLELDRRMTTAGVSQADLGRALGVQRSQIRRWLSAEGRLKADTMFALARATGCQLTQRWEPVASEQPLTSGYESTGETLRETVTSTPCQVQHVDFTFAPAA